MRALPNGSAMRQLLLGIAAVLSACAVWSLSLLAPELVGVGALGVIGARYTGGGLPSLAVLRRTTGHIDWFRAVRFAVMGQVGYYAMALTAVRFSGATVVMGIVGMTPVVMAVVERRADGRPVRPLLLPLAGSATGLLLLSTQQFAAPPPSSTPAMVGLGVLLSIAGLASWTWASIDNGRYLRANPRLSTVRWSSATSVAAMVLASPVAVVVALQTSLTAVPPLLVVAATVGVGGSWLAVMAFGHGVRMLPAGLAGQLLVVETVLGLVVLSAVRGIVPGPTSLVAVSLLIGSVVAAVRVHARSTRDEVSLAPVAPRPPRRVRAA